MTRSPLWREFESGDTVLLRVLRHAILAGGVLFLGFAVILSLDWKSQLVLAMVTLFIALWIDHASRSYLATLTLMLLSVYSTLRYGFWRVATAVDYFRNPAINWTALDALFIWMLLLAEGYAITVLFLGYLQMLWPLRRTPVPLPDDPDEWPAVDLLIPTYNEPLSVVRFTVLAAMNIDWPADKLNVYLLDDGKREEFRAFAEEAGVGYMARDDNRHAKAGNINHALGQIDSPLVAIFDCDHIPTRSFLQLTVGWFLRDPKLAMLQTPQHCYSPDPFERNLDQFRVVPSEDELFYGVVQDGNDFWNATFFCGSCALLRRSALNEIGGVAVETVTEDAHTSLRMQTRGWNTAYINIPQAAGLATERLSAHIRQRIRWARGMVQVLRLENPLFASGLKPAQRLCYFNAMAHFLYALPRLIFLTAPLIYLAFGIRNIPGFWAAIVAYAVPHLALANLTSSRIHGRHRHSFWNEIYETVMAPYILLPTLFAFIRPQRGRYNVTRKGGVVEQEYFDARIAWPFLLLLAFNGFGLLCAVPRFFRFPVFAVPGWLSFLNWPASLYDANHAGVIWVNVLWALFNLAILGVVTAVAWESQQRRHTVRVALAVPSDVILPDGSMVQGVTSDLSGGGVRTTMDIAIPAKVGDAIKFVFPVLDGTATLPAKVIGMDDGYLRARFDVLSLHENEALTMLLYSRANAWLGLGEASEPDHPLRSMARILRLSLRGLAHTLGGARSRKEANSRLAASTLPLVLFALLTGAHIPVARAEQAAGPGGVSASAPAPAGTRTVSATAGAFDQVLTLTDMGVADAIVLRGVDSSRTVYFSVPRNRLVKAATMKLHYHFSPALLPQISQLNVSLNGTLIATLAVNVPANTGAQEMPLQASLSLPTDLLVHDNQLTFEFIGHYTLRCEDPTNSTLWSRVDANSTIELAESPLPLANDLKDLPFPFYNNGTNPHPVVPIVFLTQPSTSGVKAAGIIASWFGILDSYRSVQFTVSIGSIPAGNAIVIAENPAAIPASLGLKAISGATVAMATNPSDPYSNLLVVAGNTADELLTAAAALTLHGDTWQGSQVSIRDLTLPTPRKPDDAPRWADAEKGVGDFTPASALQTDGSSPIVVYLHIPPDLDFGERQNIAFHLSYRYNGVPLDAGSTLQIYMNGAYISSTPLPHTDNASAALETVVPIPVVDLRPFFNTMTLKFVFQRANAGRCDAAIPQNLQGAILGDSHLDLTDIPRSTLLPNLELFANAGYPFTRNADLADTTIVLPYQPTPAELGMFFAIMGHFGAQTGYPALYVTVTDPTGMTRDGGKNYLVLGTMEDQPALKMLDSALPVGVDEASLHIRDTRGFFGRAAFWHSQSSESGQLETSGGLPDALIEGIEWPAGSRRSVIVVAVRDSTSIPEFLDTFLEIAQSGDIARSVSILHAGQFTSYRMGDDFYRLGEISIEARAATLFQDFPWLLALVTVMFCYLMAVLIQAMLRRRARMRLHGEA